MDEETADAATPPALASRPVPEQTAPEAPRTVAQTVWQGVWPAIFAVLLTLAGLWFLGQETKLLRYLVVSFLLSTALEPAVKHLHEKHGWRRGSATLAVLAATLVAVVFMIVLLVPALAGGVSQISHNIPAYIAKLNAFTEKHFNAVVISSSSAQQSGNTASALTHFLKQHTKDILGLIGGALGAAFDLLTIAMFTFYLTASGPQIRRAVFSRLTPQHQEQHLWAWNEAVKDVGGYLYSRGLLAVINGTFMFITLKIVGVPYALPLAMFVGVVAEFIPVVGTYLAGAAPAIIALGEVSATAFIVVIAEMVVYQEIENYYLAPRISEHTMDLNAGIAFGAAIAGGAVGGFVGAFFALPVAAVIQSFLTHNGKRYDVVDSEATRVEAPKPPKPPKQKRLGRRRRGAGPQGERSGDG